MFVVFREWWLLRRIRLVSRKGDTLLASRRIINVDSHIPKDTFLYGIAEKRFWIFYRSKKAKYKRVAKDKKILDRSSKRMPPLIEEKTYLELCQEAMQTGSTRDWLREHGITEDKVNWHGDEAIKDEISIRITGYGATFTFGKAFAEFYKEALQTYWSFLVLLGGAIVASPWFLITREWLLNKIF